MQMTARWELIHRRIGSIRVFHTRMHKAGARGKMMKGNQIIVLTVERDERIFQSERRIALQRAEVIAELVAYVDGGCLGNPGPSGIGVVINGCASGPVRIA